MLRILASICLLLALHACKKEEVHVNLHENYFGMEAGRYVVYDALEVTHLSNNTKDTLIYQLKTVIGDTVHDNSGRVGRKFIRYKRTSDTLNWTISDVWFIIIEENRGELIEENQRIVKLVFAPKEGKTWNGNAFNTNEDVEYTYEYVHQEANYNGFQLDSTVKVLQEEEFNLIEYKKKFEIYSTDIGLIQKHVIDLNISNYDINQVSTGKEYYLDMIDFGVE